MNKIFSVCFIFLFLSEEALANVRTGKFHTKSVAMHGNGNVYKRVGSWYFGCSCKLSKLQCARACANEPNCKSVYVDGKACVFGVDDVTTFVEGEIVTPGPNQKLSVKGNIRLIKT